MDKLTLRVVVGMDPSNRSGIGYSIEDENGNKAIGVPLEVVRYLAHHLAHATYETVAIDNKLDAAFFDRVARGIDATIAANPRSDTIFLPTVYRPSQRFEVN